MRINGWNEDAQSAMENGSAYFQWWDRVKTGVLFAGIAAVIIAYNADKESKRRLNVAQRRLNGH
jgi:hypothetical protein